MNAYKAMTAAGNFKKVRKKNWHEDSYVARVVEKDKGFGFRFFCHGKSVGEPFGFNTGDDADDWELFEDKNVEKPIDDVIKETLQQKGRMVRGIVEKDNTSTVKIKWVDPTKQQEPENTLRTPLSDILEEKFSGDMSYASNPFRAVETLKNARDSYRKSLKEMNEPTSTRRRMIGCMIEDLEELISIHKESLPTMLLMLTELADTVDLVEYYVQSRIMLSPDMIQKEWQEVVRNNN